MNALLRGAVVAALLVSASTLWAKDDIFSVTGGLRAQTQLNLDEGTGYADLDSGPGSASYLKATVRPDDWTTIVMKLGTPYTASSSGDAYNAKNSATNSWLSGVGIQEAYALTDLLGETKVTGLPVGLKLQVGMFRLKPAMFSRGLNFGFGTGDDYSRAEIFSGWGITPPGFSYESYKWAVEVPVLAIKDAFPLSFRLGSDLDLTGAKQSTGFTGYAEISGRNLYLVDDLFVVDWVGYYTYKHRDAAPSGTPYANMAQIGGGQLSVGFGLNNGISFGLGGAADWTAYSYDGQWAGTGTIQNYGEGRLNWQAGADVTFDKLAKVYGAYVVRNGLSLAVADADGNALVPYDYVQNFVAFRVDILPVAGLTPYFGGSYVLSNKGADDDIWSVTRKVDPAAAKAEALSWEAGLMWAVSSTLQIDAGYTKGENHTVTNFASTLNAYDNSDSGALFARVGWKF